MRKRYVSKIESRTAISSASLLDAAGYGAAGMQDIEASAKSHTAPAFAEHERVALLILAPLLAITAMAGVMFTLAG